jgi:hypothetical protein
MNVKILVFYVQNVYLLCPFIMFNFCMIILCSKKVKIIFVRDQKQNKKICEDEIIRYFFFLLKKKQQVMLVAKINDYDKSIESNTHIRFFIQVN